MSKLWWTKTIFVLILIGLSIIFLLPAIGPIRAHLPSWYTKKITSKIVPGLDLQGGLRLVYEVDVERAVTDKCDQIAIELRSQLKKKGIKGAKIRRRGKDKLLIRLRSEADQRRVSYKFLRNFSIMKEKERHSREILLQFDQEYVERLRKDAVEQAVKTIRQRVDELGIKEPSITSTGNDIIIELPGMKEEDFEKTRRIIRRTARLEFKIVDDESDFVKNLAPKLPKDKSITLEKEIVSSPQGPKVSYYLKAKGKEGKKILEKFLSKIDIPEDRSFGYQEVKEKDPEGGITTESYFKTYYLKHPAGITGEYITDAMVASDPEDNTPYVALNFDHRGAAIFEKLTGENIKRRMAIVLDERIDSAPVIQDRIPGGRAKITLGGYKDYNTLLKEAHELVIVLKAGALPAPITPVNEQRIGPTLGADAIKRGIQSMIIGAILVIIFMIIYYSVSGLIANFCLLLNMLFLLAILAGFEATLTLPGIAGIILTVGMAVDANVIIFERIREELRVGKSPYTAVETGFSRAFWTIFDAQLTTFIAGVILLQYGTGPVKGFAVTLMIGIITSMFTGIFVSKIIFERITRGIKVSKLRI
jgi:preprotein translocase subunit SecD